VSGHLHDAPAARQLAIVGIGAGLSMASLSATAMAAVPRSRAGMAGGALSTFRQLGYALGIAVLGEVFRGGVSHAANAGLAGPLTSGAASAVMARSAGLARVAHQAFADGLDATFAVAAGIGVAGAILVIALVRAGSGGSAPSRSPSAAEAPATVTTAADGVGSPPEPVRYR
jgi:hypothetical protein